MHCYYIILGAQTADHHGCALIYRSEDLLHGWVFAGQLNVPGFENFGDMWECPTIEKIGGKEILMFCPQHLSIPGRGNSKNHNGYIIGSMDWNSLTFQPVTQFHVLDFGFDSYAAACANNVSDPDKAILVAWMGLPDSSYPTDEEDWQGCLTLPRELRIRGRRLVQQPLPQLKELRDLELDVTNAENGAVCNLPRVCEMEFYCRPGDYHLRLFSRADGEGGLRLDYNQKTGNITIDRSGMEVRFNEEQGESRTRNLNNGLTHLRIFIDRSSIEIFVNDGDAVFTSRVFPKGEETHFQVAGDTFLRMWTLKRAIRDDFVI